jgi:hypothetical protein
LHFYLAKLHIDEIWAQSGLTWAHLGSPGLTWAHLGSPGLDLGSPGIALLLRKVANWRNLGSVWAHLGSPGLTWAHLGSPGLTSQNCKLTKSGFDLGSPGLDLGSPGLDLGLDLYFAKLQIVDSQDRLGSFGIVWDRSWIVHRIEICSSFGFCWFFKFMWFYRNWNSYWKVMFFYIVWVPIKSDAYLHSSLFRPKLLYRWGFPSILLLRLPNSIANHVVNRSSSVANHSACAEALAVPEAQGRRATASTTGCCYPWGSGW